MEKLKNMMIDILKIIKETEPEKYCAIEKELYEICEGKILTKDKAEMIIQNMKPYGMRWTINETDDIKKSNNLNSIRSVDFWIVMNSAYNDFHNIFTDNIDMYVKYAKEFILDEDAIDYKVYEYFITIPKKYS